MRDTNERKRIPMLGALIAINSAVTAAIANTIFTMGGFVINMDID